MVDLLDLRQGLPSGMGGGKLSSSVGREFPEDPAVGCCILSFALGNGKKGRVDRDFKGGRRRKGRFGEGKFPRRSTYC
jgi:hypothetical protein